MLATTERAPMTMSSVSSIAPSASGISSLPVAELTSQVIMTIGG